MNVLFGLGLETGVTEVPALLAHAARADRDGLDLVSLSDHPYFPDRLDAYAALGFVLGRTSRITGAVSVSNLATRPTPMLARAVAALTALSGGRVVLGVGTGGLWDDIARLGLPRRTPGEAVRGLAESIALIRALHGGGPPVTMTGEFVAVRELAPSPMPCPPIWTGSGGPASLAVTGRLADGWIPGYAADWRSRRVAESRPLIDAAAVAAGRDPSEIATIYNVVGPITPGPLRVTRDADGRWLGGSVAQWAEELAEVAAGGFVYHPTHTPTDVPVETLVARWATEVVPAVRAARGDQQLRADQAGVQLYE